MTMQNGGPQQPVPRRDPFTEWFDQVAREGEIPATMLAEIRTDKTRVAEVEAAERVFRALRVAKAIGLTLLPPDKFTAQNAIELARFVYDVTNDIDAENEAAGPPPAPGTEPGMGGFGGG